VRRSLAGRSIPIDRLETRASVVLYTATCRVVLGKAWANLLFVMLCCRNASAGVRTMNDLLAR